MTKPKVGRRCSAALMAMILAGCSAQATFRHERQAGGFYRLSNLCMQVLEQDCLQGATPEQTGLAPGPDVSLTDSRSIPGF